MSANLARHFTASGRMTDVDCISQIKMRGEFREVIGVCIQIITVPRLTGAAVTTAVMLFNAQDSRRRSRR